MTDLRERCERCRHTWSFHGNGKTNCKATGCHSSAGKPCVGFVKPAKDKALSTVT